MKLTRLIFFFFPHRYVPVQTLKLSKLRTRQIAEPPKLRVRYPKKFALKVEEAEPPLLKNDLPWTLHPLPPPLPTSKTSKLEADKSMPWALHPLPPPMKTKTRSDYYWPGAKTTRKKKPYGAVNRFVKKANHKYPSSTADRKPAPGLPSSADTTKSPDFKPSSEYNEHQVTAVDHTAPVEYTPAVDYYNHVDHSKTPDHYNKHAGHSKTPDNYNNKHVEYKNEDYNHVDYKSPDYKNDYPKAEYEDDNDHHHPHDASYHNSYPHDDHTAEIIDSPSPPSSAEYVSHITIEPSIQIASFSETELQLDDGTKTVLESGGKQKCQCVAGNGHRHKRDTAAATDNSDAAATDNSDGGGAATNDSNAEQSSLNAYVSGRPNVGHATDIQILKSHDITDQSTMMMMAGGEPAAAGGHVQQARGSQQQQRRPPPANADNGDREQPKMLDAASFRDESDKFKVDFGREIGYRGDKSKSPAAAVDDKVRSLLKPDDGAAVRNADNAGDDYGYRLTRRPNRERGYHVTKSRVENSDRGVAFSVQTPFSVTSFSSNTHRRRPDNERGRNHQSSRFRYTDDKATPSPFRSEDPAVPLDFEQFGLQSAVQGGHDGAIGSGQWTQRFPAENFGGGDGDGDGLEFSGRFTSHFPRGFDDRSRTDGAFRHDAKQSPLDRRFNNGRSRDETGSVLEYFQPVVLDFDAGSRDGDGGFDSVGFSKFKKNQNPDRLRLPGRLHESNENAFSKMLFHPSTFDID